MNVHTTSETEAVPQDIVACVDDYLRGAYHGDGDRLTRAFHPEAHIVGFLGEKYIDEAAPDFAARIAGEESEEAAGHPYNKRILDARWTERTASVSVETEVHGMRFVDYLLLMKIDGRWVIRNKIYTTL